MSNVDKAEVPKNAVSGIEHSAADTLEVVKTGAGSATVLAVESTQNENITNHVETPIAEVGDEGLHCGEGRDTRVEQVSRIVTPIAINTVLAAEGSLVTTQAVPEVDDGWQVLSECSIEAIPGWDI